MDRAIAPKQDLVKSAARSLDILDYLADHQGATLTDLHRHLRVPVSSLHNIVMTMVEKGYLARNEQTLIYRLGPQIGQLASSYYDQLDLVQLAEPYMNRLARLTGETTSLTVLRRDLVVFIHKVIGEDVQQIVNPVGTMLTAHTTGSGKAMMAYLSESELDRIYPDEALKPSTSKSITTKTALKERLAQIARDGYAFDDEESSIGLWAVAGCIRDHHGQPAAAISVAGLAGRVKQKNYTEWPNYVKEVTEALSVALGYRLDKG